MAPVDEFRDGGEALLMRSGPTVGVSGSGVEGLKNNSSGFGCLYFLSMFAASEYVWWVCEQEAEA